MRFPKAGTILGFIALFVALGGTGYAALALPKNSVTTKQVKDHSLMSRDFKRGQLPAGRDGADGADGLPGPQGPAGPTTLGHLTAIQQSGSIGAGVVSHVIATCPNGMHVISGGYQQGGGEVFYSDSFGDKSSWSVGYDNFNGSTPDDVVTVAYCAPADQAVAARVVSRRNMEARRDSLDGARLTADGR